MRTVLTAFAALLALSCAHIKDRAEQTVTDIGVIEHVREDWAADWNAKRVDEIMRANGLDEVLDDPHLKAVGFFETREHPTEGGWRTIKPPVKFSKTPATIRTAPPRPGQDTKEITGD